MKGAIETVFTMAVVHELAELNGVKEFFTQYLLSQTAHLTSVYIQLDFMNSLFSGKQQENACFELIILEIN